MIINYTKATLEEESMRHWSMLCYPRRWLYDMVNGVIFDNFNVTQKLRIIIKGLRIIIK